MLSMPNFQPHRVMLNVNTQHLSTCAAAEGNIIYHQKIPSSVDIQTERCVYALHIFLNYFLVNLVPRPFTPPLFDRFQYEMPLPYFILVLSVGTARERG